MSDEQFEELRESCSKQKLLNKKRIESELEELQKQPTLLPQLVNSSQET